MVEVRANQIACPGYEATFKEQVLRMFKSWQAKISSSRSSEQWLTEKSHE